MRPRVAILMNKYTYVFWLYIYKNLALFVKNCQIYSKANKNGQKSRRANVIPGTPSTTMSSKSSTPVAQANSNMDNYLHTVDIHPPSIETGVFFLMFMLLAIAACMCFFSKFENLRRYSREARRSLDHHGVMAIHMMIQPQPPPSNNLLQSSSIRQTPPRAKTTPTGTPSGCQTTEKGSDQARTVCSPTNFP